MLWPGAEWGCRESLYCCSPGRSEAVLHTDCKTAIRNTPTHSVHTDSTTKGWAGNYMGWPARRNQSQTRHYRMTSTRAQRSAALPASRRAPSYQRSPPGTQQRHLTAQELSLAPTGTEDCYLTVD